MLVNLCCIPSSVEVLKQKLTNSWAEIDTETVHVTCDQVIPRLCQVIKEKRGYIKYSNCMNAHWLLLSTNAHCLIYNK